MKEPDYGSYIPRGGIAFPATLGAGALALTRRVGKRAHRIILGIVGAASLFGSVMMIYFAAFYDQASKLSTRDALTGLMDWDGKGEALDIGTGSGLLAIGVARRFPEARVVGTDIWKWKTGSGKGFGKDHAEANAAAEGVGDRVSFKEGDARELPFPDDSFDAVVTNLVWHNIPVRDRYELIREALRVLKPGGVFVFSDLFRKGRYRDLAVLTDRMEKEVSTLEVEEASVIEGLRIDRLSRKSACVLSGRK